MTVGERIRLRRKELGISAEYVADKLGCSATTIYRYEKGDIEKMPVDILRPIASALSTTPEYLMGWESENSPVSNTIALSPNEDEFLSIYRDLNTEGQEKLLGYASDLAATGNYKKSNQLRLADKQA